MLTLLINAFSRFLTWSVRGGGSNNEWGRNHEPEVLRCGNLIATDGD